MIGIISGTLALLTLVFGALISLNVLHEKSDVGQVFFTDEQRVKVYFYRLFMLSFILFIESFLIFIIVAILSGNNQAATDPETLGTALALGIGVFLLSILSLGRIIKWYQNIFIKRHYKFRITLPSGEYVYIIRMLNSEICICSKDPDAGFKENTKKTFLVPVQNITEKPLVKISFPKPKQTWIQKIFD